MNTTPTYSKTEIENLLQQHSEWKLLADQKTLSRTFTFKDFDQTMAFVNAVADVAREQDHHPEMRVGYKTCRLDYTTHSAGGLTEKDALALAAVKKLPQIS